MAKKINWMEKLRSLDGAVQSYEEDTYRDAIQTPSPAVNFALGCGTRTGRHGLPRGFSWLLGGQPKGGKTLLIYSVIGMLHKMYPEAIVLRFDTEMKEQGAMTPEKAAMWGIDLNRYVCVCTNDPAEIFDKLANDVSEWVAEGMPLALVIIDSLNDVQGKRAAIKSRGEDGGKKASVLNWQIGDLALVLQEGVKMVLPLLRRNRISLIVTCHVGAEFDENAKRRGEEWRLKVAKGLQHNVEIWSTVERVLGQKGSQALVGEEKYIDTEAGTDLNTNNKGFDTTHGVFKLRVVGNSFAPPGRTALFTCEWVRGLAAQEEEVFLLAKNRGLLRPEGDTGANYYWGPNGGDGKGAAIFAKGAEKAVQALRDDSKLYQAVLAELYRRDRERCLPPEAPDAEKT